MNNELNGFLKTHIKDAKCVKKRFKIRFNIRFHLKVLSQNPIIVVGPYVVVLPLLCST